MAKIDNIGTLASMVVPIRLALEEEGFDAEALLEQTGIEINPKEIGLSVITEKQFVDFATAARDLAKDSSFILRTASRFRITHLHSMGVALSSSQSIQEFFELVDQYSGLIAGSVTVKVEEGDDDYRVILDSVVADQAGYLPVLHAVMFYFISILIDLSGRKNLVNSLELHSSISDGEKSFFEDAFNCEVTRGNKLCCCIDKELFRMKLPGGNHDLLASSKHTVDEFLKDKRAFDVVHLCRLEIRSLLIAENCNKETVAQSLNISSRRLSAKLAEKNTSYQKLLDEVRCELALEYLRTPSISLQEISYRLGFNNYSNFSRVFKKATGLSPKAHRNKFS